MTTPEPAGLSERELEILRLVATGASNKEIASQLFISSNTVKVHLRNIFAKIGSASRTEAAMYAVHIGLVQGAPTQLPAEESPPGPLSEIEKAGVTSETLSPRRIWPRWASIVLGLVALGLTGLAFALGRSSTPEPLQTSPASPATPFSAISRWQVLAPLPTARRGLALAAYENQLYAIGGETDQGVTGALERYDVETDAWIVLPSKPVPASDVSAAVINGLIYIPGGRTGAQPHQLTRHLEIYNPALEQWQSGAELPIPLSAYALISYEGRLFLFGGWNGEDYLSTVFMYDPALDTWQERTSMPTARAFSGAAAAGGKIYVIGGTAGESPLDINEIYTPARDSDLEAAPWDSGFPLPDARQGFQVATIADSIYVLGGANSLNNNYSLIYIPQNDTWQSLEASPQPLGAAFGLASIGPQLYIVGGELDSAPSAQNLAYKALITLSIPIIIK